MSTPSKRRLVRDFRRLETDPPHGITAAPLQDDIMQWEAIIFGPDDSAWEGGTFKLTLSFTQDYPNKAPTVKFVTKMFHPNIYADGSICLDILQHNWSPIYDIAAILTSIQSLLTDPNPNSPANVEAAKLYQENRREYERRVQQVVEESWDHDNDSDKETDDDASDSGENESKTSEKKDKTKEQEKDKDKEKEKEKEEKEKEKAKEDQNQQSETMQSSVSKD
ncbi:hypothetical protein RFI_20616 [Reticulomyxa filosa]|uniref:UBC core domain-containing protein n=1 Tax=Reticulomyxa filosa TaxID=46433 RepID=X6MSS0_RETFI|nr:hypothetical protein RFI_20616 [Reticulomyxa filosa]|eukprot:ETO16726.1 hypothetical protein RFI_20616 [Reticulomyxa filosa]